MKVFVTGASGFIGSAVVQELVSAGHQVVGLARSDASARSLTEAGAEVLRGSLEDIASLQQGAKEADGVIHTAFIHDFSNYEAAAKTDKAAIEAIGAALAGTHRPFIVTGGTLGLKSSHNDVVTEDDEAPPLPRASEVAAIALVNDGVTASVIRLPPSVHDKGDKGFIPMLIQVARDKGVSAYVGEGNNHWPAVHRLDAARLFRLALEKGTAGNRYNGIGDGGIPVCEIAAIIGKNLNLPVVSISPEEAANHFGWMSRFIVIDCPASSNKTRELLGWQPTHIGLIADMEKNYFES